MKIIELIRLEEGINGTFGVLKINKQVFCYTLEPPDRENAVSISSIPAKQYMCRRVSSPRFGVTFEVGDVPGRTHILFHAGNIVKHTEGCILLGNTVGKLNAYPDTRAVLNSGETFKRFLEKLTGYDNFSLTIKEVY